MTRAVRSRAAREYPSTLLDLLTRAVRPRCSTWVGLRLQGWTRIYTARIRVVAGNCDEAGRSRPIVALDEQIENPAEHGPVLERRARAVLGDKLCDEILALADFTYLANQDGAAVTFSESARRAVVEALVLHDVIDRPQLTAARVRRKDGAT